MATHWCGRGRWNLLVKPLQNCQQKKVRDLLMMLQFSLRSISQCLVGICKSSIHTCMDVETHWCGWRRRRAWILPSRSLQCQHKYIPCVKYPLQIVSAGSELSDMSMCIYDAYNAIYDGSSHLCSH